MEEDVALALANGHIGFARTDARLRVLAREGRLSQWLPEVGANCCECALLFGMEDELRILLGNRSAFTLPGVHVPELGDGLRANIVIQANAQHGLSILTMADYGAGEIENLLTAERRAKQMADEKLLVETQRANVQTRINAITQERARIARDLHDTLVQAMVAVLANLRLVLKVMDADPQRAISELGATERLAREGLESARVALAQIRSNDIPPLTLGASIRALLEQLRARLEIEVTLDMQPEADDLTGLVAEGLSRVAEEALRNTERHARAHLVQIEVRLVERPEGRYALMRLSDDGIGFDPSDLPSLHFGLLGMSEQMDLLGGRMSIESVKGKGVELSAEAPLLNMEIERG